MRELNVNEIEQVNGGLTVSEGLGAVAGVIGIAAAAPIVGTIGAVAGLAGIIGLVGLDIYNTASRNYKGSIDTVKVK